MVNGAGEKSMCPSVCSEYLQAPGKTKEGQRTRKIIYYGGTMDPIESFKYTCECMAGVGGVECNRTLKECSAVKECSNGMFVWSGVCSD